MRWARADDRGGRGDRGGDGDRNDCGDLRDRGGRSGLGFRAGCPRGNRCAPARAILEAFGRDERGTVTAEFAIVMPAVLVVLGLAIGGIFIAAQRITLVTTAADVARLEARGDEDRARARLQESGSETSVHRERSGPLHCVTLGSRPGGGLLSAISIESRACAAVSGEHGVGP